MSMALFVIKSQNSGRIFCRSLCSVICQGIHGFRQNIGIVFKTAQFHKLVGLVLSYLVAGEDGAKGQHLV